jgi:hypothetical protein
MSSQSHTRVERGDFALRTETQSPRTHRALLSRDDRPILRRDFGHILSTEPDARALLTESLRTSPFAAYFWETAPISREQADAPVEYVIVDSPRLASGRSDRGAFAEHFSSAPVTTFANLSGDAHLVVPCPIADGDEAYAHLATFVRRAPGEQIDALWIEVGHAIARWTTSREAPLWVSTSGLGVAWLHVRLDARPKYYSHRPYCEPHE